MIVELVMAAVVTGSFLVGSAQDAPSSDPEGRGVGSESRLFAMRSDDAWEVVQRRLKELGLGSERVDRTNQVVLTKWRALDSTELAWLPRPALSDAYVAKRVRFEVFVSPFAEPARVYVGSVVEGRHAMTSAPATAYNVRNVNQAVMGEIAKALGQDGRPIPSGGEERRRLALSLVKEETNPCLRRDWPPAGGKATPPRKLAISEFEVLYPAAALEHRTEGAVQVLFTIQEDGGVTDVRVQGAPLGRQLEASAVGAASLLIYSPAKVDGCPISVLVSYTVRYRVVR